MVAGGVWIAARQGWWLVALGFALINGWLYASHERFAQRTLAGLRELAAMLAKGQSAPPPRHEVILGEPNRIEREGRSG